MRTWLLWVVFAAYGWTAVEDALKQSWAWAGVWACYAGSAVFFILLRKQGLS